MELSASDRAAIESFEWIYWGMIVHMVLFGVTVVQTWQYFFLNKDRWPLRTVVYFVFLLDAVTAELTAQTGRHYFLGAFGDFGALEMIVGTFEAEITVTMLLTFVVQLSIVWQIYIVRKSILPALLVCVLFSVSGLAMGIYVVIKLATGDSNRTIDTNKASVVLDISNIAQLCFAVTDLLLAAILSYVLLSARSAMARSQALIKKIVIYSVNRGILLSACQIAFGVLGFIDKKGLSWAFFHLLLSKLYTNTMLAIYNARPGLRRNDGGTDHLADSLSTPGSSRLTALSMSPRPIRAGLPAHTLDIVDNESSYDHQHRPNSLYKLDRSSIGIAV